MFPPIYEIAAASVGVRDVLGEVPRLYLFGEAPQDVKRPYAVWQQVYGAPENYLNQVPDMDSFGTQVDVYAATASQAREVAKALRDALEPVAYVTAWNGEGREADTRDYRYGFTVEFMQNR